MDAVELPLPVDVAAAPKLMGSEGFGRVGVSVKDEDPRPHRPYSTSIECCNSRLLETASVVTPDVISMKTNAEFPSLIKGEELSKNLPGVISKICPVDSARLEGVPLQRKTAKASRSNNSSCSKKPRISQLEDFTSPSGIEESKDSSDKLGLQNLKCTSPDKIQVSKQKSNASKRSDRRNFKIPSVKSKFESSMKMGASMFSSACGGNNFFGLYGLKHDFHDATTLVDEPPLDELLKGAFDRLSLSKDKGKNASRTNESFVNSIRKACSIIQFRNSVQTQNMAEMDCSSNKSMSNCQLSSGCVGEGFGDGDNEQSCTTVMSSCTKDPSSETETRASPLDFPLCQPKDVLERIALHPSRDLESLLLDVSKPAITTKNSSDLRSGKQVLRRPCLPAFPWSHGFGGHSRSNPDTVKLSTSRNICQGKWARINVVASSTAIDRSCFTNLDSFNYDQSLVPSTGRSANKSCPSLFANLPIRQCDSSSTITCSKDSQANAEYESQADTKFYEEQCPRVLAAARTLCEIAIHSPRQNQDGFLRWQRKASHKATKAYNFKSTEKLEQVPLTPVSVAGSDMVVRRVEQIMPSKKPRISTFENKNIVHSNNNNVKKGNYTWSTSKSSRSFPPKPVRDSVLENKRTTASTHRQNSMMPPPARDLDKAYGGQQQVGKLLLTDWKRGRDKSD
ncbi:hypothetical protein HN51_012543 [Arachis hypogaea]|uniref:Uncharacterized protein n=1 Tax=Arachis hypogaea TaxID=3818 RepID=A0A445DU03_ARAHY|nr:uncharacterized protein DS421_3g87340 [Arachis hypogaea]RYR66660.1 hypothetical protein Ahy_A03g012717 isoform A [Arachis hypogaea]